MSPATGRAYSLKASGDWYYMITGSVASMHYGEPQFTMNVDLVVHFDEPDIAIVEGQPVYFSPPEYVILSKLEFYREGGSGKHLRDIRGMLAVSAGQIDRALLDQAAAALGLGEVWRTAQSD